MEPVTHALTSLALSRAGLNKTARLAAPMLIVSGLVADVDWITRLMGARIFLHGHHTATHSLLGTAVLATAVASAFFYAGRKYPQLAVPFRPALLICVVGASVHLLLDMLNSDGIMLLWPFSRKWFAWDLAASVDLWIIFFLLVGLLVPPLFLLILDEIGSTSTDRGGRRGAAVSVVFVMLFIGGRAVAHQQAVTLLDSRTYGDESPLTEAAFPQSSTPFFWSGVAETDDALVTVEVPLSPGFEFDPYIADIHFKPKPSSVLETARNTQVGIDFLNYARFPLANVESTSDGFEVRMRDLRYETELPGQRGIIALVDLDREGRVVSSDLEFDRAQR